MKSRKVIILDAAKVDFRAIKRYVKKDFGDIVWDEVNVEFKDAIRKIGLNAEGGKTVEELEGMGGENFKMRLVRQTKIVYEYDNDKVLVHMFIHSNMDFRTHLFNRIFNM